MDSLMERCEDSFYGFIATGPTVMTLNEFKCLNSSFVECVRNNDPPKRLPISLQRRLTSTGSCDTSTTEDCTRSTHLSTSSSISFTNAVFTGCTESSTGGGGLYIGTSTSNRGTLTLTNCSFTSCSTTQTTDLIGGGGVMVDYAKVDVTSTNFTSCSSGQYGGAFCWDYGKNSDSPTGYPFFKSCTFCENSATYGADLCFRPWSSNLNPFDSNCITYNSAENITGYLYKSGQGPSASWVYTNQQWITRGGSFCPQPPVDDVDGIIKYPHLTLFIRHHL